MPIDENSQGVGEDFSGDSTGEMPDIPRPDFLEMKLSGQLPDDGFYAPTGAGELPHHSRRTGAYKCRFFQKG